MLVNSSKAMLVPHIALTLICSKGSRFSDLAALLILLAVAFLITLPIVLSKAISY
jgi:hypothetical protein